MSARWMAWKCLVLGIASLVSGGGLPFASFAQEPIKVGILHSLSGSMAPDERRLKDVLMMMIEDQNERGGVLGRQILPIVEDAKSEWPTYAEIADEMLSKEGVSVIFGGWTSSSRKAMIPVLDEHKGLLIYPAQFEGEEDDPNIVYAGSPPSQQTIAAVSYLLERTKAQRWVLVGTDYVFPRVSNQVARGFLKSHGVAEDDIMELYVPFGFSDWSKIGKSIGAFVSGDKTAAIISTVAGQDSLGLFDELHRMAIDESRVPMLSLSLGEENLPGTSDFSFVGQLAARTYFNSIPTELNLGFQKRWSSFKGAEGGPVTEGMANYYSAFQAWVKAVETAGSSDPDKVKHALPGISVANLAGGVTTVQSNLYTTKAVLFGKAEKDATFSVVAQTPPLVVEASFSDYLPDSGHLVSDWRSPFECASFNVQTGKCEKAVETNDARTLKILYATTREQIVRDNWIAYGNNRAKLSYGAIEVQIPETHKFGAVADKSWSFQNLFQFQRQPNGEFQLKTVSRLGEEEFRRTIDDGNDTTALIFVHGFNNTFEGAAFRFAQLIWDSQYAGIPVMYAWPSLGSPLAYSQDNENSRYAALGFHELIETLRKTKVTTINVIAHSMGSQVVISGLNEFGSWSGNRPVNELIFAAPDFDRGTFENIAPIMEQVVSGITLYASRNDKALIMSKRHWRYPRAGDASAPLGPLVAAGMDTIDVSSIGDDVFGLNHSTYAYQMPLLNDIAVILNSGLRPPSKRSPIIRGVPEGVSSPSYWSFPPSSN